MVTFSLQVSDNNMKDMHRSLQGSFQRAGSGHNYQNVSATFHPFKEFKATWQRCGDRADFLITDYMEKAGPDLLDDFAECLFHRIKNKRKGEMYSPRMREWLQSSDFIEANRPLYLRRSRNIAYDHEGQTYDLEESYSRLVDVGMVPEMPDHYLTWTRKPNQQRMGYCSVLMHVIAISQALDRPDVPGYVTDYVLYHELLHLEDGLAAIGSYHDHKFRTKEREYPRWREAESWLKRIASGKLGPSDLASRAP
jgi:hypothetical protein